jgi:hypothetical protein
MAGPSRPEQRCNRKSGDQHPGQNIHHGPKSEIRISEHFGGLSHEMKILYLDAETQESLDSPRTRHPCNPTLRGAMTKPTSFQTDIRPLFTERDIEGMRKGFNLDSYDEVKQHAAAIYDRIRGIGGAVMPPPPPRGEGPWPQSRIELFAKWMADGFQP